MSDSGPLGSSEMTMDDDKSLSDAATLSGDVWQQRADVSLGDERTLGETSAANVDTIVDDIEVTDLEARYKIEGILGQGGMGAVQLAVDTRLGRKVAIKRILGEAATSKAAVLRFVTEAKAIAALNHPNIVQIYDYGRAQDGPFLIMEFVDGGSLADLCKASAVPLEQAVELICQVCDGLGIAHEQGIVHRDIKPANILINRAGVPKLTDFGLAKADVADHGMTMTGAVMGTPDFMPPEQRKDAALVDHRSDLWALAATLYQLLTGRSPKIVRLHEVHASMQPVLAKALEDEKHDRYQSAAELREAIRSVIVRPSRSAMTAVADLIAGECPKCREANDGTRKFCRNADCAAPLRVPCLAAGCGKEIPIWDKVCPECGAKQQQLVAVRVTTLEAEQELAQQDLQTYDFDAAVRRAEALGQITDARLGGFGEWGRTFLERVKQEKEAADELHTSRLSEAKAHREAYDYAAAIHALESLPEQLRSSSVVMLLSSLRAESEELTRLLKMIRSRISTREVDGLLNLATRALELKGDRADLRKMVAQLREREDKLHTQAEISFNNARDLFRRGNAKESLEKVASITTHLTAQQKTFKEQLQKAVIEEERLSCLLASAKADGAVTPDEVVLLANQATLCLKVNPRHSKIATLQMQLAERIEKSPNDFLRHVTALDPFISHFSHMLPNLQRCIARHQAAESAARAGGSRSCPRCGIIVNNGFAFIDHLAKCK